MSQCYVCKGVIGVYTWTDNHGGAHPWCLPKSGWTKAGRSAKEFAAQSDAGPLSDAALLRLHTFASRTNVSDVTAVTAELIAARAEIAHLKLVMRERYAALQDNDDFSATRMLEVALTPSRVAAEGEADG